MRREVEAWIEAQVTAPARIVLAVGVAAGVGGVPAAGSGAALVEELLEAEVDGAPIALREVADQHGTRLHLAGVPTGLLRARYRAVVEGREPPRPAEEIDLLRYLRQSRYCESDRLHAVAQAEFGGLEGVALLAAVSSWVGTRLAYVGGSSRPTDGAVETMLAREGVCRDFAHLCIALLRARDVPARLAAVYAPGLAPMDFHAVAEAYVDGGWYAVDATALAPRSSMLRIATGRDAADTAFLTVIDGAAELRSLEVAAVVDALPFDDVRELVALG